MRSEQNEIRTLKGVRIFFISILLSLLYACASSSKSGSVLPSLPLENGLSYQRIVVNGQESLVARKLSPAEDGVRSENSVQELNWYSTDGVLMKTNQGRLIALNMPEWSWSIRWNKLPAWSDLQDMKPAQQYTLERDYMPGYRLSEKFEVTLRKLTSIPENQLYAPELASQYTWFEEKWYAQSAKTGAETTQTVIYAVDYRKPLARLVYSSQCLRSNYCIVLQEWPVQP